MFICNIYWNFERQQQCVVYLFLCNINKVYLSSIVQRKNPAKVIFHFCSLIHNKVSGRGLTGLTNGVCQRSAHSRDLGYYGPCTCNSSRPELMVKLIDVKWTHVSIYNSYSIHFYLKNSSVYRIRKFVL